MNRTTRIKTAQAPRMYNIDLTDQLDGETQTFTLEKPLNEQCTYYVIWNGTTYRNDPQNTWFSFNEDWDELTTYFDHAPTPGAHRSLILVVSEAADGSDVGTEVYMDSEHQDFVRIETDGTKVTSINGMTVSGLSPEELQAIYDAIDDVASDVSAVSRDLIAETLARGNADANLQAQIDAITASSDVKDIVGTKAELDQYDTSTLGDRDIIKVLQDETENNATTYYRWSISTSQFSLIGEEGPYYTKSAVDVLLLDKADKATTYTKTEVDALISAIPQPAVFTGATSTDAGTSGLVPAPAAGDEDKVLKGDGTWGTVQGGIPTDATFWGQSYDSTNNKVDGSIYAIHSLSGTSFEAIKFNYPSSGAVTVGEFHGAVLGRNNGSHVDVSETDGNGRIKLWAPYSSILARGSSFDFYSQTKITNVKDPTAAQDAATKNYTDNLTISYAALNGTAAPTTATEGKYVGQLYYDTTNEQLYFLKEIDDTTTPATYTWETVGGSSVNVVQTAGTSTTDVMSQKAASNLVYPTGHEATGDSVNIGIHTKSLGNYGILINPREDSGSISSSGHSNIAIGTRLNIGSGSSKIAIGMTAASSGGDGNTAIGYRTSVSANGAIAIGGGHMDNYNTMATHQDSVALGSGARTGRTNEVSVGGASANGGPLTRYIAHVTDPSLPQDAATKNYVDTAVASAGATTYTNTEFNNLWENA